MLLLSQVMHAGEYFVGFRVLDKYPHIKAYYERAATEPVWQKTCPTAQDIVDGFLAHDVVKRP